MDNLKIQILKNRIKNEGVAVVCGLVSNILMFLLLFKFFETKLFVIIIMSLIFSIINTYKNIENYKQAKKELDEELKNINKNNKNE